MNTIKFIEVQIHKAEDDGEIKVRTERVVRWLGE
jgi:hypothetical protein